ELYSLALPLSKTGAFIDLQDSIMAYKDVNTMTFAQKQVFAGRAVSGTTMAAVAADQAGGRVGSAGTSGANQTGAGSAASGLAAADDDGEFISYTVQRGDTLWDIAKKFTGVSDTDISRWNNLTNSSKIQPGQKIRIRKI
ncbi:MAG: LysM peptidoglycan-binding domain-containing protein, partial [Bacteroidales bacterium]|nr:LysM peptidoglycan-binding domain-containing protein [Bacteroidales bacterium]